MRRRDFILATGACAAGGAGVFWNEQRIDAAVDYPGRESGHWLRDARSLPEPTETFETEVLIAGAGIAGLTAGWQLAKCGVRDVMVVPGPESQGNAACGHDGELRYPTGAHYLPLPSIESVHMREMLDDMGIIRADAFGENPTFDERYLVHAPAERVLFRGAWQEGYLPVDGVSAAEKAEQDRFFALVDNFSNARGRDGRRAFVVPIELASSDERFRDLDRVNFKAWLAANGFFAPSLRWYLDYCCRDDYGRHFDEISAWAGLHYFCSRNAQAANAERGAVLTWPEGLSALATRLEHAAPGNTTLPGSVARLIIVPGGVEALCVTQRGGAWRTYRVRARQAIAAMPLYVLQHVLVDPGSHGFLGARDLPGYAPWMVSNFIMRAFPEERGGSPLSWDNVVYQEPGLGFVVSTHQDIRLGPPPRTVFSAYHALSDLTPDAARHWLQNASTGQLSQLAARDLRLAYGWRLPLCVERLVITVRAHAMAIPHPGFLDNAGCNALRSAAGPLFFAHSDLSGLSLFEEAAWWGYRAVARLMRARQCRGLCPSK